MKSKQRKEKLALRAQLTQEQVKELSKKIIKNLEKFINTQQISCVFVYYPIKNEVDTIPLINRLLKKGIAVGLPSVQGGEMKVKRLVSLDELIEGDFHIPEPSGEEYIEAKDIDLMLMPLSVYDKQLNRIGYGGGYYDKYIATQCFRGVKIGLAYSFQEADVIDAMEHDIKLDYIINEEHIITRERC